MFATIKKNAGSVLTAIIAVVSLVLMITAVSMLTEYKEELIKQADARAIYNTQKVKIKVHDKFNDSEENAVALSSILSEAHSREELYETWSKLRNREKYAAISDIRYFIGDTLYTEIGDTFSEEDPAREAHAQNPGSPVYLGTFQKSDVGTGKMSIIGFYIPTPDSDYMDAIAVYYTRKQIEDFFSNDIDKNEKAEFSLLCTTSGEIVGGRETVDSGEILELLGKRIGTNSDTQKVTKLIDSNKDGTVSIMIKGEDYLVSVSSGEEVKDLCIVELYRVSDLVSSSFEFVNAIIGIFLIFALISVAVVLYLIIHRIRLQRAVNQMETFNNKFNCFNRNGFEKEVASILEQNSTSQFSVIVYQLRHYKYLKDTYGEDEADKVISYLRTIDAKNMELGEAHGYIGNGEFLMLIHAKDRDAVVERLKTHVFLASQYRGAHQFDVLLKYGIYEIKTSENVPVNQMIDFAIEANNSLSRATIQNATMRFNFYNDDIRKIRLLNEDMELRMEGALQNEEFQVFYQPKYNLKTNRQDGCEALVRWYDKKTNVYNRPDLFMTLFESNGFIVKLDKYVYTKVCEYISYSIANGRTVYPVSVNVSRITAVQPDFVEYYTNVKRKYGIADKLLTIEFTESFAYENYETLSEINSALHKNGFKCSIDDFGCGYSSYRILKELPMDEIKLDKFFLENGELRERDKCILESVIKLGKELGMKVTQEGVETEEELASLRELNCDVIQGYLYSHPLPLTDYIEFTASSREHNLN